MDQEGKDPLSTSRILFFIAKILNATKNVLEPLCMKFAARCASRGIMHEACLLLFLHRYNTERAILLK